MRAAVEGRRADVEGNATGDDTRWQVLVPGSRSPIVSCMYTVIGTRPDGNESLLEYRTLDEAMQKLRDLIEADEMDDPASGGDGPMFIRYAIEPGRRSAHGPPTLRFHAWGEDC